MSERETRHRRINPGERALVLRKSIKPVIYLYAGDDDEDYVYVTARLTELPQDPEARAASRAACVTGARVQRYTAVVQRKARPRE